MSHATPGQILKCPIGTYIKKIRTKNDYNQWITGVEFTCSDGSVVQMANSSTPVFGVNGTNTTASTYDTPNGFTGYDAYKQDYWTFNLDTYYDAIPVSKGANVVTPGWTPTKTSYKCPANMLVNGMTLAPCYGDCSLFRVDQPICETAKPPDRDCMWKPWGEWGACSAPCGYAIKMRFRENDPAVGNGLPCFGDAREIAFCPQPDCPEDGYYTNWGDWSPCDRMCGGGTQSRTRRCVEPRNGGKPCEGPDTEFRTCNTDVCPVDGGWSDWSAYGDCESTDGTLMGWKRFSYRECNNPAPVGIGQPCRGDKSRYVFCSPAEAQAIIDKQNNDAQDAIAQAAYEKLLAEQKANRANQPNQPTANQPTTDQTANQSLMSPIFIYFIIFVFFIGIIMISRRRPQEIIIPNLNYPVV